MGLIPFDSVNTIWPTKAQILFYKRIAVKTNMKKQGIVESVSSRNYMKKRKVKTKEMTNIARNAYRNKTKSAVENAQMRKKTKSDKRQKKTG